MKRKYVALGLAITCFFASGILFLIAFTQPYGILLSSSSTSTVGTFGECTNGTCTTITNYPTIEFHESFVSSWAVGGLAMLLVLVGILAFGLSLVEPPPVVGQTQESPAKATEPVLVFHRSRE